jgi:cytosine/adenosine deaminase-related metal-dependent hydrolase
MAISLQARVVYPVDRPPIERGYVTIESERIVAIGKSAEGDVQDLGDVALLPGFVNAHTHLEFSYLKQPLGQPGMRLPDWIRLVIAERGRNDVSPMLSVMTGRFESKCCGVAVIGDIATTYVPGYGDGVELKTFAEVIGFSRARAASALSNVIERLNWMQRTDGDLAVTFGEGNPFGISPHAPYTVSQLLLIQLIELAQIRSLPVAMHLAESEEELEFLHLGTGPFQLLLEERSMWDADAVPLGTRPLDYLRMLAEAPRALIIHGNYLDAEERAFLADAADRMSLVYCPRTHAYFDHAPYPLAELLAGGVRVVLGTDSRASTPDLSLLAEMRRVRRAHPQVGPHNILRMATLSSAEALGCEVRFGSLTPGKLANIVAVPLDEDAHSGPDELLEALLTTDSPVWDVWLRGEHRERC